MIIYFKKIISLFLVIFVYQDIKEHYFYVFTININYLFQIISKPRLFINKFPVQITYFSFFKSQIYELIDWILIFHQIKKIHFVTRLTRKG